MVRRALAVLTLVPLALLAAGCGSESDSPSDAGSSTADPTSSAASDPASSSGATGAGSDCAYSPDALDGYSGPVQPPSSEATETGTIKVTLQTGVGDIGLRLDADAAPCTVHSFLSLAQQGFFDDTTCPRLTTAASGISVLQCGDPDGPAAGPGYTVPDEITGQETYGPGTLAMANTGQPNTGGSQFFIVYGDSALNPTYTVFGSLDDASLDLVSDVAAAGVVGGGADGTPQETVKISSVAVQ